MTSCYQHCTKCKTPRTFTLLAPYKMSCVFCGNIHTFTDKGSSEPKEKHVVKEPHIGYYLEI